MAEIQGITGFKPYPTAGVGLTFTALTAGGPDTTRMSGNDCLIFFADGAGDTLTIARVANSRNRTLPALTTTLASGEYWVLGPMKDLEGWNGSAGLSFSAAAATTKVAVLRF